jgi:hypothetical protein
MKNNNNNNNINNSNLPDNLHSVLIGIMLGDGFLYKTSATSNTRFEMSFGEKYEAYAKSIEMLFKDYINNPLKAIEIKGINKTYINYRLKTKTLPLFNYYHDLFYSNQTLESGIIKTIKIVPNNIIDFMDPIVLAYLIQSDGSYSSNRVRIYTNSFTKSEVELLAQSITIKFNIISGVTHDRNNQFIISIGASQLDLLRNIVATHFHASMLYRIGL